LYDKIIVTSSHFLKVVSDKILCYAKTNGAYLHVYCATPETLMNQEFTPTNTRF